jgi:hypothetical protein
LHSAFAPLLSLAWTALTPSEALPNIIDATLAAANRKS